MLLTWYIGLIVRPIHTIQQIANERPLVLGMATFFVMSLVTTILNFSGLDAQEISSEGFEFPDISFGFVLATGIVIAVYAIPMFALLGFIPHLTARLLGGNGTYLGYLSTISMTTIVILLVSLVSAVVWFALSGNEDAANSVSGAVSIAGAIWGAVLWVLVIRENYQLPTGVAILTALITIFVGAIVFLFLAVILGLLLLLVWLPFGLVLG